MDNIELYRSQVKKLHDQNSIDMVQLPLWQYPKLLHINRKTRYKIKSLEQTLIQTLGIILATTYLNKSNESISSG